jgi:hypothetical protein
LTLVDEYRGPFSQLPRLVISRANRQPVTLSNEQDADNFNLPPPLDITHQAFDIAACLAIDMATPSAGQLGVTAPLSVALPTEAELQASAALVDELKRQNNYESPVETNKRYVSQSTILDEP